MKNILIFGAGAMGAAFSIPCIDNKNRVTLCEPYNFSLIKNIIKKNHFHPGLKLKLSKKLETVSYTHLRAHET